MVDLLGSFTMESAATPLKLFSTGPLFRPGRSIWTEAVDVELLGDDSVVSDEQMIQVVQNLVHRFDTEIFGDHLTIVYGQVNWLDQYLQSLGIAAQDRAQIRQWLQHGNLTDAENWLLRKPQGDSRLFRPEPPDAFFSLIKLYLPTLREGSFDGSWRSFWDLSLTGNWPYYSGLVFTLYHNRSGQPLANGGRFEIKSPTRAFTGVGFTLYLEAWQEVLSLSESYAHVF